MLKIYGDGCNSTMNSFNTGCFIKDGVLGTLRTGESYVGLADDAAGTVFAVVAAGNTFDAPCKTGCAFQRIDVATHTITSQKQHPFTSSYYFPLMPRPIRDARTSSSGSRPPPTRSPPRQAFASSRSTTDRPSERADHAAGTRDRAGLGWKR